MTARYSVTFRDQRNNEWVTLKVNEISDSPLGLTFVRLAEFVFGGASPLLVNPAEEALQRRFEGIAALHLSIHAIHTIEELVPEATLALEGDRSKIVLFNPEKR